MEVEIHRALSHHLRKTAAFGQPQYNIENIPIPSRENPLQETELHRFMSEIRIVYLTEGCLEPVDLLFQTIHIIHGQPLERSKGFRHKRTRMDGNAAHKTFFRSSLYHDMLNLFCQFRYCVNVVLVFPVETDHKIEFQIEWLDIKNGVDLFENLFIGKSLPDAAPQPF